MSNEKISVYTRANDWRTAAGNIYHLHNWRSLEGMRGSDNEPQDGAEYRVTVERIEPEPEKRYSVWRTAEEALSSGAYYGDWDDAKKEWLVAYPDFNYRIFDHSTNPPTDVTDADPDAEPDKRWWQCYWDYRNGYEPHEFDGELTPAWADITYCDKKITVARANIHSATEPTFAEFAAAVKDVTGVEIPQPEEPTYWHWRRAQWSEDENADGAIGVVLDSYGLCDGAWVYGTTADRDAKRDALLAAAREAGKP